MQPEVSPMCEEGGQPAVAGTANGRAPDAQAGTSANHQAARKSCGRRRHAARRRPPPEEERKVQLPPPERVDEFAEPSPVHEKIARRKPTPFNISLAESIRQSGILAVMEDDKPADGKEGHQGDDGVAVGLGEGPCDGEMQPAEAAPGQMERAHVADDAADEALKGADRDVDMDLSSQPS